SRPASRQTQGSAQDASAREDTKGPGTKQAAQAKAHDAPDHPARQQASKTPHALLSGSNKTDASNRTATGQGKPEADLPAQFQKILASLAQRASKQADGHRDAGR